MEYVWAFVVGGAICVVGQLLIDYTKLTPARILVLFVTLGVVLGGLGLYEPLVDFAGAGATVPLTGFGYNMAKGTLEAIREKGFLGIFTGGRREQRGLPPQYSLAISPRYFQNPEIRANRYVRYGKYAYRGLRILQGRFIGMLLYKLLKHIYEKTRRDIERWREFRRRHKNKTGR